VDLSGNISHRSRPASVTLAYLLVLTSTLLDGENVEFI
jgi:hypothetical protein